MFTLLAKYYDIRSGEGKRTGLMFAYIFSIIAFILITKSVSTSLFLNHVGIKYLPYVYILVAVFSIAVISIYNKLTRFFNLPTIILYTNIFSIFSILLFWLFLTVHYQTKWFFYLFYIWVTIFSLIAVTQFWLLANYVFNAREAKRLFGFLGIGAIVGGIFGGYVTNVLAPIIHLDNMLLLGALFLVVGIFLVDTTFRKAVHIDFKIKTVSSRSAQKHEAKENPLKLVTDSALLSSVMLLIIISIFTASLVDYQFNAFASDTIKDPNKLAAFLGFWLSTLSVVSLLIQVFLTQKVITLFGVLPLLVTLPVGILIGAFGVIIAPGIVTAVLLKLASGSLKNSIDKSGLELLIVPVPSGLKNRTKTFIDVFADNFATGLGGVVLILLTYRLNFSVQNISYIIISLVIIQIFLITTKLRKEYINSFRQAIERRSIDFKQDLKNVQDTKLLESLLKNLSGYNEKQILFILDLLPSIKDKDSFIHLKELTGHMSAPVRVAALKLLSTYQQEDLSDEVVPLIHDEKQEVSIEAIRYVCQKNEKRHEKLQSFLHDANLNIKSAALLCLANEVKESSSEDTASELINAFKGLQTIIKHSKADNRTLKTLSAKIIATSQLPELYHYLEPLLHDNSRSVQREAIQSAGVVCYKPFIPTLIKQLNHRYLRRDARKALANYGESVIPDLKTAFKDSSSDRIKRGIIKVLGEIQSQTSVELLLSFLNEETFPYIYEVIKALTTLSSKFTGIRLSRELILAYIFKEIGYYQKLKQISATHYAQLSLSNNEMDETNRQARVLFVRATDEKLQQSLERIFRMLGLLYGTKDILQAYQGLRSRSTDMSANSIEFLDTVLSMKLKKAIMPIAEEYSSAESTRKVDDNETKGVFTDPLTLNLLLKGNDNWLRVCSLYLLGSVMPGKSKDIVQNYTNHSDAITRETAELIMERNQC